jgi:hypothetical protein
VGCASYHSFPTSDFTAIPARQGRLPRKRRKPSEHRIGTLEVNGQQG